MLNPPIERNVDLQIGLSFQMMTDNFTLSSRCLVDVK